MKFFVLGAKTDSNIADEKINANGLCPQSHRMNFTKFHNLIFFHNKDTTGIVDLLLENGADLSIQDNNGDTPLHVAADNGK